MPETLRTLVSQVRRRLRARAAAHALAVGGGVFALLRISSLPSLAALGIAAIAVATIISMRWRFTGTAIAGAIEAGTPADNLLVTAAELEEKPRPLQAEIRDAINEQASARAAAVDAGRVVPLRQPIAVAAAVVAGCVLLARPGDLAELAGGRANDPEVAAAAGYDISVRVSPPAYTRKAIEMHPNPTQLTVIAGSTIRIEAHDRVVREWVAAASESLEVRAADGSASRFLSVMVVPDAAPSVRITEPGRDSAFAVPRGSLRVGVESRDDLGLTSLTLRYTKASGGGENVTFTDGEVPLAIERVSDRLWRATTQWTIDGLGLADGDVLVYRAVSRDGNPAGAAVESDAFLIEIGRTAEIASAGFALPSEEKKYAISQQMVIYKTEQLLARVKKGAGAGAEQRPDDWLEQSRMLGVEQRMVRAEVVFLSGGEVEDEVEEAAHSHELAEGRHENPGRAEMVRALNFMSRAEAQLNDGNAAEALVFERQALASLERALDRRRYFLRTLPDRSRIDLTRRLTGERREARSWLRDRHETARQETDRLQGAMRALIAATHDRSNVNASLAALVAAVDSESPALQKAAVTLANARSDEERRQALEQATAALTAHALETLPGTTVVTLPDDPMSGRLRDTMTGRPR